MWEEIGKKQNEEEMLQLQYYARILYNRANRMFVLKTIVLITGVLTVVLDFNIVVTAIIAILYKTLNVVEVKCIENAASARALFDAKLFDFDISRNCDEIKEKAYKICVKKREDFEIQKNNTGMDVPPGVKDWYTMNDGSTKREIIFKCQIENTKWDEKITRINTIILQIIVIVMFIGYVFLKRNTTVLEFFMNLFIGYELIEQVLVTGLEYKRYNCNLIKRKQEIERMQQGKIKKKDIERLQELINERRELRLVPFNGIHKYVSAEMHELLKRYKK